MDEGGETVYLYGGQRTTQCGRLNDATCEAVVPVGIHADKPVDLGGRLLSKEGREALGRERAELVASRTVLVVDDLHSQLSLDTICLGSRQVYGYLQYGQSHIRPQQVHRDGAPRLCGRTDPESVLNAGNRDVLSLVLWTTDTE